MPTAPTAHPAARRQPPRARPTPAERDASAQAVRLRHPDELRLLPDGAQLNVPGVAEPVVWLRAYARPHQDPDAGLWRLPRNPLADYGISEIEAQLPAGSDADAAPLPLRGDEDWLSTLTDPHDTTR